MVVVLLLALWTGAAFLGGVRAVLYFGCVGRKGKEGGYFE